MANPLASIGDPTISRTGSALSDSGPLRSYVSLAPGTSRVRVLGSVIAVLSSISGHLVIQTRGNSRTHRSTALAAGRMRSTSSGRHPDNTPLDADRTGAPRRYVRSVQLVPGRGQTLAVPREVPQWVVDSSGAAQPPRS